jgi:hypothetical protein
MVEAILRRIGGDKELFGVVVCHFRESECDGRMKVFFCLMFELLDSENGMLGSEIVEAARLFLFKSRKFEKVNENGILPPLTVSLSASTEDAIADLRIAKSKKTIKSSCGTSNLEVKS